LEIHCYRYGHNLYRTHNLHPDERRRLRHWCFWVLLVITDTPDVHLHFVVDLSFKHSTGSGQDVYFAIYKNGALITTGANAEMVSSADSANYQHIAIHADEIAATNDYFECYLKCATGNVIVHSAYMFAMGMPD
jgi:hypothetical protein